MEMAAKPYTSSLYTCKDILPLSAPGEYHSIDSDLGDLPSNGVVTSEDA